MRFLLWVLWLVYIAIHIIFALNSGKPWQFNTLWLNVCVGFVMLLMLYLFTTGEKHSKLKIQLALSFSAVGLGLTLLGFGTHMPSSNAADVFAGIGTLCMCVGLLLISLIQHQINKLDNTEREDILQNRNIRADGTENCAPEGGRRPSGSYLPGTGRRV